MLAPLIIDSGLLKSSDKRDRLDFSQVSRMRLSKETAASLAASSFMVHCKTATALNQLRNLLALEYRFFELCNALPAHTASRKVLAAQTPDTPGVLDEPTNEAGSWCAACILFFHHSELPKKFPDVSNALHACWQTIYKKPIDAAALATQPHDYDDEEIAWCTTSTAHLKTLLDEHIEQGRACPCGAWSPGGWCAYQCADQGITTAGRRCWCPDIPTRPSTKMRTSK